MNEEKTPCVFTGRLFNSASGYRLEYTYTATGAVSQEKLLKNGVWDVKDYTYNLMERVVQESQGDGSQDDSLSTSYRYNQAGELIGISYIKEDNQASVAQGSGIRVTGYVYDTHGRITSIHSGTGNSTIDNVNISALPKVREYIYATNGDLQKTKDYRGFDEAGNTGLVETVYDYNSYGAVNKMTRNDGSSKKEEYTMSYNRLGYITGETLYTNYGTAETVNKSYTYDNVGRLTNTTEDGKTTAYEYDKVGNRTKETITDPASPTSIRTYTYNNLDQLQQISEQKNGKAKTRSTYTYDNRGNQVGEVNLSMTLTHPITGADSDYFETVTNTYDLRDLLITTRNVTESADEYNEPLPDVVNTSSNSYYADGKRSERVESIDGSEVTTQFYYVGDSLIYSTNESRVLQTENVLDLGGQIVASKRFTNPDTSGTSQPYANKYYLYSYDIRGSVSNIIGPDGNVVTGYAYDAFGNKAQTGDGSFINDVTYTGSVSDDGSGLQYMNARFYQPETGRFLSQDTYTGVAADPRTQNLYSYCGSNPVNFVDLTGHEYISEWEIDAVRKKNMAKKEKDQSRRAREAENKGKKTISAYADMPEAEKAALDSKHREIADLIVKGMTIENRREFGPYAESTFCIGIAHSLQEFEFQGAGYSRDPDEMFRLIEDTIGARNVTRVSSNEAKKLEIPQGTTLVAFKYEDKEYGQIHFVVKESDGTVIEKFGYTGKVEVSDNSNKIFDNVWIYRKEEYEYVFSGGTTYYLLDDNWQMNFMEDIARAGRPL
ncbi:MAG: RHS repeat-associated core domain-containing protein [Christensenellaceae bacterium]